MGYSDDRKVWDMDEAKVRQVIGVRLHLLAMSLVTHGARCAWMIGGMQ